MVARAPRAEDFRELVFNPTRRQVIENGLGPRPHSWIIRPDMQGTCDERKRVPRLDLQSPAGCVGPDLRRRFFQAVREEEKSLEFQPSLPLGAAYGRPTRDSNKPRRTRSSRRRASKPNACEVIPWLHPRRTTFRSHQPNLHVAQPPVMAAFQPLLTKIWKY